MSLKNGRRRRGQRLESLCSFGLVGTSELQEVPHHSARQKFSLSLSLSLYTEAEPGHRRGFCTIIACPPRFDLNITMCIPLPCIHVHSTLTIISSSYPQCFYCDCVRFVVKIHIKTSGHSSRYYTDSFMLCTEFFPPCVRCVGFVLRLAK